MHARADARLSTTTALLSVSAFALMCAYYVVKALREPLLLATGTAELKSYAAAGQAVVLLFAVPGYAFVSSRLTRGQLLGGTATLFALSLLAFHDAVAAALGAPPAPLGELTAARFADVGCVFFVWIGVFAVSLIAQFWALAADVYEPENGSRAFPSIGLGAALGAAVGAKLAAWLGLNADADALLVAAALISVHAVSGLAALHGSAVRRRATLESSGGFDVVFSDRYVVLIAAAAVVLATVNTLGEFILGSCAVTAGRSLLAAGAITDLGAYLHEFYGDFYFTVNASTLLLQALVVSRLLRAGGVALCLFVLPVVAIGTYGALALGASLFAFRVMKVAENSVDYSVMNTARALLWIPTTPEQRYQAKQAIDTFFVRGGDVLQAVIVFVGTSWFHLGTVGFALVNLLLIAGWLGVTAVLATAHRTALRRLEPQAT